MHKADPNLSMEISQPPLHVAVQGGHESIVGLLIDTGAADVNSPDKFGQTALGYACSMGNVDLARAGVECGANVNILVDADMRNTPLMMAVQEEDEELVSQLLDHGAIVDAVDANGQTAVMHAAVRKLTSMVDLFVSRGADVTLVDNDGKTAQYYLDVEID